MQSVQPKKSHSLSSRSIISNLLLVVASAGLVVWSGQLIKTRVTSVISRDAIINGVLIDLKTPAPGIVDQLSLKTGDIVTESLAIATLKNERVSKLSSQEIISKINEHQAEIEAETAKLNRLKTLLESVKLERQNQLHLATQHAQESVEQVASDLKAAQAKLHLAQLDYKRTNLLAEEGALPRAVLDKATLEMREQQAIVESLEAKLAASKTNQNATKLDLSLNLSRSGYDPTIRQQEIQMDIDEQKYKIKTLQKMLNSARSELVQAQADLGRQVKVAVNSPTQGVIWRLVAQKGKYLEEGEIIGQVLDCKRRWVDVYVDEQAVRSLQPGTPASVELYGSTSAKLEGRVSLVRSGVGRLAAGEDVAIPVSPNLPRNTQVRVELDPNANKGSANLFCYVGYTGRVTFQVKD
ncbi:MAG: HlyD family efflux transporter periplasmic adaptor subunit [Calothrix sp. C42_A2020_038]|nr:HlyD family efflux transporter periplasmic adaptor subunit [Calothrix sp. C42_A2020_038]